MDAGVELGEGTSGRRRHCTAEEKQRIVEQTLSSGLSVASVAREHSVNANQSSTGGSSTGLAVRERGRR